uniref:Utp12 domain-containing protein n=1 Tax=Trichuris muris TaxID=70415 RepID=A0A5S6QQH7_TRIMR
MQTKDADQSLPMEAKLKQVSAHSPSGPPESTGDSIENQLTRRLVQAMLLKEENLITVILVNLDADTIKGVAESIPKAVILPFLSFLADRLRSGNPSRIQCLLWLKHVLAAHSDFLTSNSSHIAEVGDIFPFLNTPLPPLEDVLKLVGRFQLLAEVRVPADMSEGEAVQDIGEGGNSVETANELPVTTNVWSELREPELWNRLEATDVYGHTDDEQEGKEVPPERTSRKLRQKRAKVPTRKRRTPSDT